LQTMEVAGPIQVHTVINMVQNTIPFWCNEFWRTVLILVFFLWSVLHFFTSSLINFLNSNFKIFTYVTNKKQSNKFNYLLKCYYKSSWLIDGSRVDKCGWWRVTCFERSVTCGFGTIFIYTVEWGKSI
jgi:hypothetical protein